VRLHHTQYIHILYVYRRESEAYLDLAKNIAQQVLNNAIKQKLSRTIRDGVEETDGKLNDVDVKNSQTMPIKTGN